MDNSLDWLIVFWAVLMCGYRPLLLNMRLPEAVLEETLINCQAKAVISDEKEFSINTIYARDIVSDCEIIEKEGMWGEEVIFMSSGTSGNVKLCAYSADNFYYQVGNSIDILKKCPQIAKHYQGELKLLTLLPFYHVFGFMAVYLWFGFFSRTFVFLKSMNPKVIQNTIKKHKVTHFFAVPLVWESVYKAADRAIKAKGDKTYRKFKKGLNMADKSLLGEKIVYKSMKEVRDSLFGESIKFLISGGGDISKETLKFFNGIGYHIANGYGMTEVGITSVDVLKTAKQRNKGSIGSPFTYTEYKISEKGTLLIKGKNMASRILCGEVDEKTNYDKWFDSNDLCEKRDNQYYLLGRHDDLIVLSNGENLNPTLVEKSLNIAGAESVCLILEGKMPILLISTSSCYCEGDVEKILKEANEEVRRLSLDSDIKKIVVTPDSLIKDNEFKVNRKKIAKRYKDGEMTVIDNSTIKEKLAVLVGELENEIRGIFAETLHIDVEDVDIGATFFADLGGTSLDYFMLSDTISQKYGVDIKAANGKSLTSVGEVCEYIKNH